MMNDDCPLSQNDPLHHNNTQNINPLAIPILRTAEEPAIRLQVRMTALLMGDYTKMNLIVYHKAVRKINFVYRNSAKQYLLVEEIDKTISEPVIFTVVFRPSFSKSNGATRNKSIIEYQHKEAKG